MGDYRHKTNARQLRRVLLAVLCVLLVVVAGALQVAHTHTDGTATHADCGLCATAHISVQVAYAPASVAPVALITVVESLPAAVVPPALSTFALFTRPPPAAVPAA